MNVLRPESGLRDGPLYAPTVLLVEESPARSLMLTLRLKGAGYRTFSAVDVPSALRFLCDRPADLVITDLRLGDSSGFDLCRALRAPGVPSARVLVLTDDVDPSNVLLSLEAGVDAFLPRSAGTERILERVETLLARSPAPLPTSDPLASRVEVLGREYRIATDREHLLSLLVSAFEDVVRLGQSLGDREKATAAKLASVLDTVPSGILVTDAGGEPTLLNEGGREMMGLAPDAAPTELIACRFRAPGGEPLLWNDLPPRRTGQDTIARFGVEVVVTRKDGSEIPVIVNSQGVFDAEGRVTEVVSTLQSNEERERRKRAEAQLALAERMASVGTLAAGVAHEINNPLTWLLGNLEELEEGLADGVVADPVALHERAREASEGARRIRSIVKALKTFSHGGDDQRAPVPIEGAVELALRVARTELRYRVTVEQAFSDTPPVLVNEGRLSQVFLNLIVNASQAFVHPDPERNRIRLSSWADGDEVVCEVRDNGPGIARQHISRLFDPFFTTKPAGVGSGLGLSICHNIVRAVDGHIDVETEVGVGTAFRVRLPRAPQARYSGAAARRAMEQQRAQDSGVFPSPAALSRALAARAAGERPGEALTTQVAPIRVLVVDDEELVAGAIARLLRRRSAVTVAHSGRQALQCVREQGPFDAIVSDLMMDDGSGMELHAWLSAAHPEQARRMIFLTGGAFTEEASRFLAGRSQSWLEKPVSAIELRAAVQAVAARGGGSPEGPETC